MMGVDFHRHSAMVGTVEKGERSRPRSRGKRLSAQPLVSAHPDTRVQSCGTTYAPGCRMVRPDGGTCFWRSTSLTVVWGPHHDALTPPQPCVCRDFTVFSPAPRAGLYRVARDAASADHRSRVMSRSRRRLQLLESAASATGTRTGIPTGIFGGAKRSSERTGDGSAVALSCISHGHGWLIASRAHQKMTVSSSLR